MKRILILSDINSSHTQRWALAMAEKGMIIGLYSLSRPATPWYKEVNNIQLLSEKGFNGNIFHRSWLTKIYYLRKLLVLMKVVKSFQPEIIHSHYASSYGLLGALIKRQRLIISCWGSDIYTFPNINFITKLSLRYALKKADFITATSKHLATAAGSYTTSPIQIIPFGINVQKFALRKFTNSKEDEFVIGTIKSLEKIYGIDILLRAFAYLKEQLPKHNLKLRIVGGGTQEKELRKLAANLGIEDYVRFIGKVDYDKIPDEYHKLDIFVNLSRFESFGVSVLEASASGLPVVLSNSGGLKEVGIQNVTCLYVPADNYIEAAKAIKLFVENQEKCLQFGRHGRDFVVEHYSIEECVEKMLKIYN